MKTYSIHSPTRGYWQCGQWSKGRIEEATKYSSEQEAENVAAFRGLIDYEVVVNTSAFRKLFKDKQHEDV